jgi:4-amino-4-deoxychorismate lyase
MKKLLFETIKIKDGKIYNLNWHNKRCNKARKELFFKQDLINLEESIKAPLKGLFRCRIVYTEKIHSVDYIPYTPKTIQTFKVVQSQLNYQYKFNNRTELNKLLHPNYDEILIEKNGLLTDTSIANIAFYDGSKWITPKNPLLQGTIREKLLFENFLTRKNIKSTDIVNFSHFALMNAMIGFQIQKSINITI